MLKGEQKKIIKKIAELTTKTAEIINKHLKMFTIIAIVISISSIIMFIFERTIK